MNSPWLCLALVVVSYLLGHATGYRLYKLRCKNYVRSLIHFEQQNTITPRTQRPLETYSNILREITQL